MRAILSIIGRSNTGKTTLIEALIRHFNAQGIKIATIKHMKHDFEIDYPGKDTWRCREAGAHGVAITNGRWYAVVSRSEADLGPEEMAERFFPECDLVIIEGDKESGLPKIEVIGSMKEIPLFRSGVGGIVAIAADVGVDSALPIFRRDDVSGIAAFIQERYLRRA
jgi:molybdopterin-guanine dinucleotide biosynthesis adapter protein